MHVLLCSLTRASVQWCWAGTHASRTGVPVAAHVCCRCVLQTCAADLSFRLALQSRAAGLRCRHVCLAGASSHCARQSSQLWALLCVAPCSKLVYATALIREQGCLFIATNLDHADAISSSSSSSSGSNGNGASTVGRVMPGTGSLVAAVQVASGVQPVSDSSPVGVGGRWGQRPYPAHSCCYLVCLAMPASCA